MPGVAFGSFEAIAVVITFIVRSALAWTASISHRGPRAFAAEDVAQQTGVVARHACSTHAPRNAGVAIAVVVARFRTQIDGTVVGDTEIDRAVGDAEVCLPRINQLRDVH